MPTVATTHPDAGRPPPPPPPVLARAVTMLSAKGSGSGLIVTGIECLEDTEVVIVRADDYERLCAEVERLRAERDQLTGGLLAVVDERDTLASALTHGGEGR